jgi:serine/threonine-protein phosphatase 6 regulatory ankyrin repeat subunit A/serine/threonine-protein phosphatase 6 regulatory ankyrin repeat subunit B
MNRLTATSLTAGWVLTLGCLAADGDRAPAAPASAPATRAVAPFDPGARDPKAELIWAIAEHRADVAMRLIREGADVNSRFEWDPSTALWLAAGSKRDTAEMTEVVKALVAKGADVNKPGRGGMPPLNNAILVRSVAVAQLLVEHGADLRAKDNLGFSALHMAADAGDARICKLLLEHGADVNATDKWGCTPLDVAKPGQHADAIAVLKGAGGREAVRYDDRRTVFPSSVTEPDRPRRWQGSPLHDALVLGQARNAWAALERGADVNSRDAAGYTPLHIVCYGRSPYIEEPYLCEMLLKRGADLNAIDAKGRTPLDIAMWRHHDLTAAVLRDKGANPSSDLPRTKQ